MEPPSVDNPMRDEEADITYNVKAYRKLSRAEIVQGIRIYRSQNKSLKKDKGKTITILSLHGLHD